MLIRTIFRSKLFTFDPMKRNYSVLSFLCGCIVLTALLIQSIHSFHHLEEEFSKEKCHHDYSQSETQLTHSHDFEHCFVCEFASLNCIPTTLFSFEFAALDTISKSEVWFSKEVSLSFNGSLYSLRGPPLV